MRRRLRKILDRDQTLPFSALRFLSNHNQLIVFTECNVYRFRRWLLKFACNRYMPDPFDLHSKSISRRSEWFLLPGLNVNRPWCPPSIELELHPPHPSQHGFASTLNSTHTIPTFISTLSRTNLSSKLLYYFYCSRDGRRDRPVKETCNFIETIAAHDLRSIPVL